MSSSSARTASSKASPLQRIRASLRRFSTFTTACRPGCGRSRTRPRVDRMCCTTAVPATAAMAVSPLRPARKPFRRSRCCAESAVGTEPKPAFGMSEAIWAGSRTQVPGSPTTAATRDFPGASVGKSRAVRERCTSGGDPSPLTPDTGIDACSSAKDPEIVFQFHRADPSSVTTRLLTTGQGLRNLTRSGFTWAGSSSCTLCPAPGITFTFAPGMRSPYSRA